MKLSTAAMIISVSLFTLPATASTSKTSKQSKGGSHSMSINPSSKASKQSKGGSHSSKASKNAKGGSYSYSMSVDPNPSHPCLRDPRFNCSPFEQGLDCSEVTNSCKDGLFRLGCPAGPKKPGKEVCGRMCNPSCPTIFPPGPPPFGTNPCTFAPNVECYPNNDGWPMCCKVTPDGSSCSKEPPCESEAPSPSPTLALEPV